MYLLMFISLLKDMIIDIGKQTDEEYRAGQKDPECRSFRPHGDGVCHPPIEDYLELTQATHYQDFMEASLCRHDQLLTLFLNPPLSGGWRLGLKIPNLL